MTLQERFLLLQKECGATWDDPLASKVLTDPFYGMPFGDAQVVHDIINRQLLKSQ